jgi:predicted transcriptional regulator
MSPDCSRADFISALRRVSGLSATREETLNMEHPGASIRRARCAIKMRQRELAQFIGRSNAWQCGFEAGRVDATPDEIRAMRAVINSRRQWLEFEIITARSRLAAVGV